MYMIHEDEREGCDPYASDEIEMGVDVLGDRSITSNSAQVLLHRLILTYKSNNT